MNLKSVLESTASRYGDRHALINGEEKFTYKHIDGESNRFAAAMLRAGIAKGDRVAMFLSNSPEFIITFFGIVKIGAIAVPLDQQYKLAEMKSILDQARPSAIVSEPAALKVLGPALSEFDSVKLVIETASDEPIGFTGFSVFLDTGSSEKIDAEISPEDTAAIMYTSSPALKPLGAVLSHNSFVQEAVMSAEGYHQTEEDVMMLFSLPMLHVFGLVSAVLGSIYSGSAIVIVPGTGLSLSSFMAAVEREKGTMYLGVPYIYGLMVELAEKNGIQHDLSSLRLCASAGAVLPVTTYEKFLATYGKHIIDCYGLTEAVSHITVDEIDGVIKPGSVGKTLSGWEIRIIDEHGIEVPAGVSGEMMVKGPFMDGYYAELEETANIIRDGWLDTGDIGKKDADGFLYITGRSKETIIVKGQNIYPVDAEIAMSYHPGVEEVAVMGVPDRMRGEIVIAAIHLKEGYSVTEHDLRQVCLERIVDFKIPRKIYFTGPMPKKRSGKIDKEALREQLSLPPVFSAG